MTELSYRAAVQPTRTPVAILGVPFDPVTTAEAVELIEQMIASRQPHHLATANVDFVVQAQHDLELRRILFEAHLVLCDGTPLVWASRWLGNALPERVAGADLVPRLIAVAAEKRYRVFFLGASPDAARQAVKNLRRRYPELPIAGHYSPPLNKLLEMDHADTARRIREAAPDLLFVAFGCPKQEKWLAMNYRALGVPVSIGVGATIDFLAGRVRRAPRWMQRSGTEWMYRLGQEPRRLFKRYATDLGIFGWRFSGQLRRLRSRPHKTPDADAWSVTRREQRWQQITAPARLDEASIEFNSGFLKELSDTGRHCWLDLHRVRFVDSAGIGWLARLQKRLRARGCHLILLSPSRTVRRTLAFMGLDEFFLHAPDVSSAMRMGDHLAYEQEAPVVVRSAVVGNPLIWQGEISAANAELVWRGTEHYLTTLRKRELMIDLSRLRFLDSSGVTVMDAVKKLARQLDIQFAFTRARPAIRNVLRHAGMEGLLAPPAPPRPVDRKLVHTFVLSQPA